MLANKGPPSWCIKSTLGQGTRKWVRYYFGGYRNRVFYPTVKKNWETGLDPNSSVKYRKEKKISNIPIQHIQYQFLSSDWAIGLLIRVTMGQLSIYYWSWGFSQDSSGQGNMRIYLLNKISAWIHLPFSNRSQQK